MPTALAPFDHRRHRILIPHAVGFSKTIEIGILPGELIAHGKVSVVLTAKVASWQVSVPVGFSGRGRTGDRSIASLQT